MTALRTAGKFKRPPVLASVLAVAGISVLCGLGTWQLYRLSEKEALLARIEQWQAQSPAPELSAADFTEDNLYKHGVLRGEWLAEQTIRLIPRIRKGAPGAHLYTPLRLEDDSYVLVNRGWVPQGYADSTLPQGIAYVEGDIAPFPRPNPFTPQNKPGSQDWYRISAAITGDTLGAEPLPFMLRATRQPEGASLPDTAATAPRINNNHAHYAAFWFCMAGILAVIFFLRFMKPDGKA